MRFAGKDYEALIGSDIDRDGIEEAQKRLPPMTTNRS
jgi:hypothetical protein